MAEPGTLHVEFCSTRNCEYRVRCRRVRAYGGVYYSVVWNDREPSVPWISETGGFAVIDSDVQVTSVGVTLDQLTRTPGIEISTNVRPSQWFSAINPNLMTSPAASSALSQ